MAADPHWQPPEESEKLKEIASQFLSDKSLAGALYLFIQDAAIKATTRDSVIENHQKSYAFPIGEDAKSRMIGETASELLLKQMIGEVALSEMKERSVIDRYRISYHPDDLLIVGGMAISLYDEAVSGIKKIKYQNTSTIQEYLQKNTTDIDIVWWPRIEDTAPHMEDYVVTINSPAISSLITAYISELNIIFANKKVIELIQTAIHNKRPDITLLRIDIEESFKGIKAGAKKIIVHFIIVVPEINQSEISLEICDISIHDGASSQKETKNRSNELILKSMIDDPMYCMPNIQTATLPLVHQRKINVPDIKSIIKQQLLAFKNLLDANNPKCIINYNRIRYLQLMIFEYDYQKKNANIHTIFKLPIDSGKWLEEINNDLDKIIQNVCRKLNGKDRRQLCQRLYSLYPIYFSQQKFLEEKHMQQMYQLRQMQQIQKMQQMQQQMQQHMQQMQLQDQKKLQKPILHRQYIQEVPHEPLPLVKADFVTKSKVVKNEACTLPNNIEYLIGKNKIQFTLNEPTKAEIEKTALCKYYHILNNKIESGEMIKKKDRYIEQLKRIKILIHDIVDKKKNIRIDKRISDEATWDPLKSLLEGKEPQFGGRMIHKQMQHTRTKYKQTRYKRKRHLYKTQKRR